MRVEGNLPEYASRMRMNVQRNMVNGKLSSQKMSSVKQMETAFKRRSIKLFKNYRKMKEYYFVQLEGSK
jgi:hypothetical protein